MVKHLNLRLPDDMHAELAAAAETDRRSLNTEILYLLQIALQVREADRRAAAQS